MAYDEQLTQRFRDAVGERKGITEKRMMGGVCLMLDGNMIGGADRTRDGTGRFMFRVGKENQAEALTRPGAQLVEMGGRAMSGMIFVDEGDCDDGALKNWAALALSFVQTLPPK